MAWECASKEEEPADEVSVIADASKVAWWQVVDGAMVVALDHRVVPWVIALEACDCYRIVSRAHV